MTPRNPAAPKVTVVVAVRDHYGPTLNTVGAILDSVTDDVPVLVVAGGMPRSDRRQLESLDRVRVIGPRHHLMANTARNIALEQVTTPLVAFVDNDTMPEQNWLTSLVGTLETHGATAVMALVLERFGSRGEKRIHLSGGECRIEETTSGRRFVEYHRHLHASTEMVAGLAVEQIHLLEFHCALYDREKLSALGAFDEQLEAQGEHLDLTLRIEQSGGSIWLDPRARVTVEFPTSLGWRDISMYVGRWSPMINRRSRARFVEKWNIIDDHELDSIWRFAEIARSYPLLRLAGWVQQVTGRWTAEGIAQRMERFVGRYVADIFLRTSPSWRNCRRSALAKSTATRQLSEHTSKMPPVDRN
jgi:cellulose synthase/poly-beta-1,6-N-acetylglucosamine synthase-like glycosyltransferase